MLAACGRARAARLFLRRTLREQAAATAKTAAKRPPPSGRERLFWPAGLALAVGCGCFAAAAWPRRNSLLQQGEKSLQRCREFLADKFAAQSSEPLLASREDLGLPEGLPTLVLAVEDLLVFLEYDRREGWRPLRRPEADEFFRQLAFHYEIVLWSKQRYPFAADLCAKWGLPVSGVLHREHCRRDGTRDLSRLGRDLRRVILVEVAEDREEEAVSREGAIFGGGGLIDLVDETTTEESSNLVLVSKFAGQPGDNELKGLSEFLKAAALLPASSDLRNFLREYGGASRALSNWQTRRSEEVLRTSQARSITSKLFRK